jgi:hypothetical protein
MDLAAFATLAVALVSLVTSIATSYRAKNSGKDSKLREASLRLRIFELKKKYGDEVNDELDSIRHLLDN